MFDIQLETKLTRKRKGEAQEFITVEELGGAEDAKSLFSIISKAFQNIARQGLDKYQSKGQFSKDPKEYRTVVDGKEFVDNGKLDNAIKEIAFVSLKTADEIILGIALMLETKTEAIFETGQYSKHNYLLHNSTIVASSQGGDLYGETLRWLESNPTIRDKDSIRFLNMAPYSGMLEREGFSTAKGGQKVQRKKLKYSGMVKGGGTKITLLTRQANGAYYITAKAAERKWGKNSIIKFEWINGAKIPGISSKIFVNQRGYVQKGALGIKASGKRKKLRPYAYPSIVLYVTKKGIKL